MKFFCRVCSLKIEVSYWAILNIFLSRRVDKIKTYSGLSADQNGGCNTPPGKAENNFTKKHYYIIRIQSYSTMQDII